MADNNGPHDAGDIKDRVRSRLGGLSNLLYESRSAMSLGYHTVPDEASTLIDSQHDEIERLRARVADLEGVVERYKGTTADEVMVYEGDTVYRLFILTDNTTRIDACTFVHSTHYYSENEVEADDLSHHCYSTRAAAEAARKAEKGGAM